MSNNLNFLKSAIFFKKNDSTNGKDEVIESNELNQTFLDPYKNYLLNCAGRRDLNYVSDDGYVKENEAFAESIKSYIISNIKDALFAIGSSFVDKLYGQFIYEHTEIESHYEFEFPFSIINNDNPTLVEDIYDEAMTYEGEDLITNLLPCVAAMKKIKKENDITVTRAIGAAFDRIYAIVYRKYFESLIIKTTVFYINNPNMIEDYYISFLDADYVPCSNNGHNNIYSAISMSLREMIQPNLESFKDCLFVIANTASTMVMAFIEVNGSTSYEDYVKLNPFVYEIMLEKFNKDDEEEDNETEEEVAIEDEFTLEDDGEDDYE